MSKKLTLSPPDIHLWFCSTQAIPTRAETDLFPPLLSPAEWAACQKIQRPEVFRQKLFTRGLIRTVLSYYAAVEPTQWQFEKHTHGKPYISHPKPSFPLFFNISHCKNKILIGVAQTVTFGLDIEQTDRPTDTHKLAQRFFHPAESEALKQLTDHELKQAFFSRWTLKEAYIKALGRGFTFPIKNVQVDINPDSAFQVCIHNSPSKSLQPWHFYSIIADQNLSAAVAIQAATETTHQVTMREISVDSDHIDYNLVTYPYQCGKISPA